MLFITLTYRKSVPVCHGVLFSMTLYGFQKRFVGIDDGFGSVLGQNVVHSAGQHNVKSFVDLIKVLVDETGVNIMYLAA